MIPAERIIREDSERVVAACRPELEKLGGLTVMVTGATGFIGGSLVDALLEFSRDAARPCKLLLPARLPDRARGLRPGWAESPRLRWLEWRGGGPIEEFDGPCDLMVHAASPVSAAVFALDPTERAREMIELTRTVAGLAARRQARTLLYLSSGAVYGPQPANLDAIPESYAGSPDPVEPASAYGIAKRACEAVCFASGVNAVSARLFACIGPRQSLQSGFAVPDFFLQALAAGGIRLTSDGRALRTFCYVSDVVAALIKLLAGADAPRECNVGAEAPVLSIAEVAERIARRMGGIEVEKAQSVSSGAAQRYIPDISRMKQLYRPQVTLDEGVGRIADFLRAGAA